VDRRTRDPSTVGHSGHSGRGTVRPRAARHLPVGQDVQIPRHDGNVPGQSVQNAADPRSRYIEPLSRIPVRQPPMRSCDVDEWPLPAGGRDCRVPA